MSAPLKVVVTRELPQQSADLLRRQSTLDIVQWPEDKVCDRTWLLQNAAGAHGILLMLNDKCDVELLEAAGDNLKVISSFSAGTDHVDLAALKQRGLRLGFTPSALTDAVADVSVMLVLMAQRLGGEALRNVLDGKWPQMPWSPLLLCGPQLTHATVGFVGFGRIAQATLKRLIPFQINKALYLGSRPGTVAKEDYYDLIQDRPIPIEPAQDWKQIAQESDVVIVGCALTEQTKHLVNAEFLQLMKKRAVLVNIARGPVVDTNALVIALEQGQIFGAGLDVVENEPQIAADHPLVKQPRCVLLPHIGSANIETRSRMAEEAVKNLIAGLSGADMINEKSL